MTSIVPPMWFQRWLTVGLMIILCIFARSLYLNIGTNTVRIVELEKTVAVFAAQLNTLVSGQIRIENLLERHAGRTTP